MHKLEKIAGVLSVLIGLSTIALLFWFGDTKEREGGEIKKVASPTVTANAVTATKLEERLNDIAQKKHKIREEKLAKEAQERKLIEEAEQKKLAEAARKKKLAKEARRKKIAEQTRQKEQAEGARQKKLAEEARQRKQAEGVRQKKLAEEARQRKQAENIKRKLSAIQSVEGLNGLSSYNESQALTDFGNQVQRKVKQYWILPPNMPSNLSAKILIKIDTQGNIKSASITQSSGYQLFDSAALSAVSNTSPLPLPNNAKAVELIIKQGLEFIFSP